jgi:hypothetical protein
VTKFRYSRLACNYHAILALLFGARVNQICCLCGCYIDPVTVIRLADGTRLTVHRECAVEFFGPEDELTN